MQCIHCRAWNEEDERRCVRCGRRLQAASPRPAPEIYPLTGAAAPALESLPGGRPMPVPPLPGTWPEADYQPSLFREPLAGPKVVPIPMLTPRPHGAGRNTSERKAPRTQGTGSGTRMNAGARRAAESQQTLDFLGGALEENTLGTEVAAVIYCDAPVALPVHRLMAAAVDGSMIAIATGLFLGIFHLSGGQIALTKQSGLLIGGVIGVLTFLYRLLWCLGNGDTLGMNFAGLRLVNFDGRPPDREQRMFRLAASLLSLVSAGLGLVWALVDEESLTWHDHISKTFPSPG
jgi:uncharacterized RDD family membrane protein YckC